MTTVPIHNIGHDTPYNYVPTEGVAIMFIALFAFSTLIHTGQSFFFKMWWLLPTACFCGILEVLGWSGRLWSSFSPTLTSPFQMQICATIIGPTPLLAANFVIFGVIIRRLGSIYSRITPKWYTIFFCTCDVISLVVQGVGGGLAATADGITRSPKTGGNIMLGGIAFQLFTIIAFSVCAIEFIFRYLKDHPVKSVRPATGDYTTRGRLSGKLKIMLLALLFNTTCLFIRAVYRTIELSDGWTGRIIGTQVYFNVLDGGMVILAIYTLNFAHPGWLLSEDSSSTDSKA